MKKYLILLLPALFIAAFVYAQQNNFQQDKINAALQNAFQQHTKQSQTVQQNHNNPNGTAVSGVLNLISEIKKVNSPADLRNSSQQLLATDTLVVGFTPNDTVIISGNWTHTGPIWVFNDGVLIFDHANVIDTGDVYVWGSGKLLADSSSFFFPQNYFYERSLLVLQNSFVRFSNCSFNYSGMSHNLVISGNPTFEWENVHQNDWTTCGITGSPTLNIDGCNLSGEYILNDTCHASFNHADSLILWHQLPQTALINYSFPQGDTVYNYVFNNSVSGVSGLQYDVTADSCHTVWWALMPTNGSDVTVSNSDIRLIGAWFQRGDTATAHGIFNNSTYSNYITPLSDRNLHLINSTVSTWSLYVFDSSYVTIDSCQLGEVGTQQRAIVNSSNFILDGTGGYFWSTDSSFVVAANVISYSTCRSEKKATFVVAYSWLPFVPPMAIHNSKLISVQNTLVADPIPADASVVWMAKMDQPDTASVNANFAINGSAWINQGPGGNPEDFGSYSLYWQMPSQSANWYPIVVDSLNEVSHSALAMWNTNGLTPGTYILKQTLKNNYGDSVEGYKVIELLPNPAGVNEMQQSNSVSVFPNPSNGKLIFTTAKTNGELVVRNSIGELIFRKTITASQTEIDLTGVASGMYFWTFMDSENNSRSGKWLRE